MNKVNILSDNIIIKIFLNYFFDSNCITSWDTNNKERLKLQLVCKNWCNLLRNFCKSLSLSKRNIIPLYYKIENFQNINHLEILDVESPEIVTKIICNIIVNPNMKQLSSIDLSLSNLSNIHIRYILNALKFNQTINDINLEGNPLGDQSIYDLYCLLINNNNIKYLDLQNCDSKNGLVVIGNLLANKNSILGLNWSNNDSNNCIDFLCEGLKNNNTLTSLSLSGCNIDELGAISLGEALKTNKSLRYLNLSNNQFGDIGSLHLALILKNHPTLQSLDLSCNSVSIENVEKIKIIFANTGIHLKIYQNNFNNNFLIMSNNNNNSNHTNGEDEYFFDENDNMEVNSGKMYDYLSSHQMIIS
ncbi:hypothetical protein DICPUDRAFT_87784 [Dictyostelium purpureum]|uniref:F-box domain-containing protein n=1 Tax=Dictyostelium purpureum TaxID=5786 RepID=F0ZKB4_DICPU|nr:uncharacterized protein DICPUDRAFT_87784 [Dictyostelium purpureum]EGC35615.1 hypothetical protein DICPUDRAFT_87784 [Dictyostelium purpureum]|eukprot:XP_003287852.1 hypothetical protein DICPUDRAFT_87784 [Dictyostelium purpureum]